METNKYTDFEREEEKNRLVNVFIRPKKIKGFFMMEKTEKKQKHIKIKSKRTKKLNFSYSRSKFHFRANVERKKYLYHENSRKKRTRV